MKNKLLIFFIIGTVLTIASTAMAELSSGNILRDVGLEYHNAIIKWKPIIYDSALYLFWLLASISMVWTFGFMALRKADIAEFFAEFIRYCLFLGFYLWLLRNGTQYSLDIIMSLRQIAAGAGSTSPNLDPSGIVDIGFQICFTMIDQLAFFRHPAASIVGLLLGVAILIVLALVAVNMLVLVCSSWFLMYGGVIFLGFGGSRWTSDLAINYYKTVLGVGVQIFAMVLIVGTGQQLLNDYMAVLDSTMPYKQLVVMLVVGVVLLVLVNKVPQMLSSIVSGSLGGGMGGAGVGASSALGAAAIGASAITGGVAAMGGGASAIKAAIAAASGGEGVGSVASNIASEIGSAFSGSGGSGSSGGFEEGEDSTEGGSAFGADNNNSFASGNSESSNGDETSGATESSGGSGGLGNSYAPSESSNRRSPISFAASVMKNLAKGSSQVMQDRVDERLSETLGGKIAAAIKKEVPSKPSLDEISEFVNSK